MSGGTKEIRVELEYSVSRAKPVFPGAAHSDVPAVSQREVAASEWSEYDAKTNTTGS